MADNINSKTSPNQMRVLMKRMRDGNYISEKQNIVIKDLTMRDMLKITRRLNEGEDEPGKESNLKTTYDQNNEEEKFRNYFDDMNVDIKFIKLEIFDDHVFWGGTIDGVIQFIYMVTPDEKTSKIEFNYLPDFSPDNPDNDMIVKKIESYYDIFYKYWRDNIISDNSSEESSSL
jgi:hypothetical protein